MLGARLESSLVHSCGVPPIELRRKCYKVPMDASSSLPRHPSSVPFDTDDEEDTPFPPAPPRQIPTAPPTPTSPL